MRGRVKKFKQTSPFYQVSISKIEEVLSKEKVS